MPVEIHSVGQLDGQGAFAGVHGSARDISERERLERELRDVRGALPLGHPVVAGPHLGDQQGRPVRVRLGPRPRPPRLGAGRGAGPAVPRVHRRAVGRDDQRQLGAARPRARRDPDPSPRHPPQGRVAAAVRGVVRRGRPGRRGRERLRHRARRGRARAPRARAARERGALPVPRRELARRHLRDRCGREVSRTSRSRWSGCWAGCRRRSWAGTSGTSSAPRTAIPAGRRFAELAGGSAPLTTRMELQDKDGDLPPVRGDGRPPCASTACSRASTGPRATSASASASSASCASPRSATATSSSRRPTSSG